MNADMAINLALESKDAINCELIRTIHKAPELTSLFFSFFLKLFVDPSQKKKGVCVPDSYSRASGRSTRRTRWLRLFVTS